VSRRFWAVMVLAGIVAVSYLLGDLNTHGVVRALTAWKTGS